MIINQAIGPIGLAAVIIDLEGSMMPFEKYGASDGTPCSYISSVHGSRTNTSSGFISQVVVPRLRSMNSADQKVRLLHSASCSRVNANSMRAFNMEALWSMQALSVLRC